MLPGSSTALIALPTDRQRVVFANRMDALLLAAFSWTVPGRDRSTCSRPGVGHLQADDGVLKLGVSTELHRTASPSLSVVQVSCQTAEGSSSQ